MEIIAFILILVLIIGFTVAISRWVFRINDIVDRLDKIIIGLQRIRYKE